MTVTELIATLGGSGFLILILSLIKVEPLKISVWHWIARKLGRAFNGETLDRLNQIEKTLNDHLEDEERKEIDTYRQRILRFADEMYMRKYHSKEHFEEILSQIEEYNQYCADHPDFKNERTVIAQGLIKDKYAECMKRNSFDIKNNHTGGAA